MDSYLERFDRQLKVVDAPTYQREAYQSYMTGPEWRNVEMVEEYAAFLAEGHSMFQFPYFRQMAELWRVLYHSYLAAREHNSMSEILLSEYMLMDLFVCFFTTMEMLPKALVAFILWPVTAANNATPVQGIIADFYAMYAQGLQTIPFYDHDYAAYRDALTTAYQACPAENRSWVDWLSWQVISTELIAREWLSKPLRYLLHEDGVVGGKTDILVEYDASPSSSTAEAKAEFTQHLNQVLQVELDPRNCFVDRQNDTQKVYARVHAPRYKAFKDVVPALRDENIHVCKIAGQDKVQVKFKIDAGDEERLKGLMGADSPLLYTYRDHIHPERRFCLFDVPVNQLQTKINETAVQGLPVEFVHNF